MKITAVVTCYESVSTIGQTITSLFAQTRKPDEIIVTDDGSSEETCNYVQNLLNTISQASAIDVQFVTHKRTTPYRLNTIRNNGISRATGELIFLIDGDIIVPKNFLLEHKNIHNMISAHQRSAFVSCVRKNINPDGSITVARDTEWCRKRDRYLASTKWNEMNLEPEYTVSQSTFLKKDWDRVGHFDSDFDGHWGFDEVEFAYRLKASGVILTCHGLVYHLDEGPGAGNREWQRNEALYAKKKMLFKPGAA